MSDLCGLDPLLVSVDSSSLTSLQQSLQGSLQSAAFMDSSLHAKYDLTKSCTCALCGVPDTQLHWLECPRFGSVRSFIGAWQSHHSLDTTALKAHLLPSRSPCAVQWKRALMVIEDPKYFSSQTWGGHTTRVHRWTCLESEIAFSIGIMGKVESSASTGQRVSIGYVPRLCQTNDRAELCAVVSVVAWQNYYAADVHLWINSKFVVGSLLFLQQHTTIGDWARRDLWEQLKDLFLQLGSLRLVPHWVPSHLDPQQLCDPFEDWIHLWNDRVDAAVGLFTH